MSIPKPQILYTGMNVAVPDWKSFNKDLNARMDMIRREKQQERQFQQQRQDQMNREFLKTVDMDRMNFTHGKFQQASADVYQSFDDTVSGLVEAREGEMSVQDIMKAQALTSQTEQQVAKFKNWEQNWVTDQKAYLADPTKYRESSRDKIFGYEGDEPYNESRLEIAPWDAFRTKQELTEITSNANKVGTFSYFYGDGDVKNEGEWTAKFWKTTSRDGRPIPVLDDDGRGIPNYEAQGKFIKNTLNGRDFTQARVGLIERFNELSPQQQKMWDERALNNRIMTKGQGDGEILYYMHPDGEGMNPFELGVDQKAYKTTRGGTSKDDRIDLTNIQSTTIEYKTGETSDNYVNLGGETVKNQRGAIINPININDQEQDLGKSIPASDINFYDVVGLDMSDPQNPKAHIRVRVNERPLLKNREPVYSWRNYRGTEEEVINEIEKDYKATKGRLWWKEEDMSSVNEAIKQFKRAKSDPDNQVTLGRESIEVLAPLKDNPQLYNEFKGLKNVKQPKKESTYTVGGKKRTESELLKMYKDKYPDKTEDELLTAIRKLKQ